MKNKIFMILVSFALIGTIVLAELECPEVEECAQSEAACCVAFERLAEEAISFYQDPSEAKNRDEQMQCLAACCKKADPDYILKGPKRVALQNKVGAWVS